jgi:hypothetical protein
MEETMGTSVKMSRTRTFLGSLLALTALSPAMYASPVFAESHGGGGGHSFSGGHMSAPAPHFGGAGHAMAAPHFAAAAPHYAAPSYAAPSHASYGGNYGGYHGNVGYGGHSVTVAQQYGSNGHGYAAPGHAAYAPGRALAPGRYIPGSPFRYGHWNGGYWRGGFWPRVYWGPNFAWFLPVLPAYAAAYWWNGIPYYYYNDLYYTYDPSASGYVVTTPPPAQDAGGDPNAQPGQPDPGYSNPAPNYNPPPQASDPNAAAPNPGSGNLYAYPKNGQNDQQQATDRQECSSWATGQTGSDGTAGSVDYQRALTACLQGRGYTVD